MKLRPAGERALLVEVDDLQTVHRLHAALRRAGLAGLVEAVPGARTVLVVVDPDRLDLGWLAAELPTWPLGDAEPAEPADTGAAAAGGTLDVPVVYDGQDLPEVARLTGLPADEVVRRHTEAEHTVAFLGFAPGFGYILGSDPALEVPRRAAPRTAVPAGAVGLAGRYTGIYPRATPGGWLLIGRTALRTWDPDGDPPALLRPGLQLRFRAVSSP